MNDSEKVADLFGRHADARIADGEAETCFAPFVALLRDGNKDVAGLCELDGVAYEVQQDLGKPERVPFQYRWDVRADPGDSSSSPFSAALRSAMEATSSSTCSSWKSACSISGACPLRSWRNPECR